jgi:beta-1,4-mannosyl-glycoprotein beta-1,4-N-acetylglucosaminyltransferase
MTRVIDVFPFFNELNLLKARLDELNPFVDFFVVTEATTTFSGLNKQLFLKENWNEFTPYHHKIIHQVVDSVPENLNPFQRDWFQRDAAKEIVDALMNSDDILIYGDVDEIPRTTTLEKAINRVGGEQKIGHFAQDMFYYFINLKETSGKLLSHIGEYPDMKQKKWLGTTISSWEYARKFTLTELRNPDHKKHGVRLEDGGWHFSYIGSDRTESPLDRITNKIISAAHQELNNEKVLSKISKRLSKNKDIFGRRGVKFEKINDLDFLPRSIDRKSVV